MRLPFSRGPFKIQYGLKQARIERFVLLVDWLVNENGIEQCCGLRPMAENEVVLFGCVENSF